MRRAWVDCALCRQAASGGCHAKVRTVSQCCGAAACRCRTARYLSLAWSGLQVRRPSRSKISGKSGSGADGDCADSYEKRSNGPVATARSAQQERAWQRQCSARTGAAPLHSPRSRPTHAFLVFVCPGLRCRQPLCCRVQGRRVAAALHGLLHKAAPTHVAAPFRAQSFSRPSSMHTFDRS